MVQNIVLSVVLRMKTNGAETKDTLKKEIRRSLVANERLSRQVLNHRVMMSAIEVRHQFNRMNQIKEMVE